MSQFEILWHDACNASEFVPDPAYPQGRDLDISNGLGQACYTSLPYPAKRCGYYSVMCQLCRMKVAITTAGRVDDPRSVKMPCRHPETSNTGRKKA